MESEINETELIAIRHIIIENLKLFKEINEENDMVEKILETIYIPYSEYLRKQQDNKEEENEKIKFLVEELCYLKMQLSNTQK